MASKSCIILYAILLSSLLFNPLAILAGDAAVETPPGIVGVKKTKYEKGPLYPKGSDPGHGSYGPILGPSPVRQHGLQAGKFAKGCSAIYHCRNGRKL